MLKLWSYIDAFGVIGGNGLCLLGYLDDIEALLLFTRNCPTLLGRQSAEGQAFVCIECKHISLAYLCKL